MSNMRDLGSYKSSYEI